LPPTATGGDLFLLVIADVHYVGQADYTPPVTSRRYHLGRELVRRAVDLARGRTNLDAVLIMGDLVDNGNAPGADRDFAAIRDEVGRLGLPMLWVHGNHDVPAETEAGIVGGGPSVVSIRGYRLVTFWDRYDEGDRAVRCEDDFARLKRISAEALGAPIVALQHNPIYPRIESGYPYMLTNSDDVIAAYSAANVVLSISGHYHPGRPATKRGGVVYVTSPALCESPFPFLVVRVHGREVEVREHCLAFGSDEGPVDDCHCHTEFAYCGEDVAAGSVVARARDVGLRRVCLTEHSGQLYLRAEDYWRYAFITEPDSWLRARATGAARMAAYRGTVTALRSPSVRVGLEVECDGLGRLTLADEDREGWDILLGAVHTVPELLFASPDPRTVEREFMRITESLVSGGIGVLAHPFRLFDRGKMRVPTELYGPVAELLAAHNVAAEINFHTHRPDPAFFGRCLERGVRLSLGSDAHALREVGHLRPHLDLLASIGATGDPASDPQPRSSASSSARA